MDCGLCMAHTDQTHHRNSGATVLCSVFMFPCSVFLPEALFHHVIYNTNSKPSACPPNVSFSYLYVDQISDFSRTCEDLSVFFFAG